MWGLQIKLRRSCNIDGVKKNAAAGYVDTGEEPIKTCSAAKVSTGASNSVFWNRKQEQDDGQL